MILMYMPLAYVNRYSDLTELYCSKEYSDCEPEVLLEMISDTNWGKDLYSGPNKERYYFTLNMFNNNFFGMHTVNA